MNMIPDMMILDEPQLENGFEFVDGQVVEKYMAAESNVVALNLLAELRPYVISSKLGHVFAFECTYQCFPGKPRQIRKPDVTFIAKGRFPNEELPEGHIKIAPDFAVEVISPNDEVVDLGKRIDELLTAGTRLLWVILPKTRTAWVFRKDGTGGWLTGDATLTGEDVVPGFTCKLSDLFAGI